MGEGVGLNGGARSGGARAWRHSAHHRSALGDLRRSGRRHPRMTRGDHAGAGMGVWMLTWGHWMMTRRQPWMLRDALVARKLLRHHHCGAKSPITGLLRGKREDVGRGRKTRERT